MRAQCGFDRVGFVDIAQRGGGAVGVQVLHRIRVESGVAQCAEHGAARAVHAGRGHVAGVGTHAKARQFGVNFCATGFGVFVFLEHHDARAFAQDKAVAVFVPGARSGSGVVVAGAQRAHGSKTAYAQG